MQLSLNPNSVDINMAEKIDKEVCCICLHDFNRPRKLDCSHTFCYKCLEDYIKKKSKNNLFHCPLCRQEFSLPEGGVKQFMSNVNVVETPEGATENSVVPPCETCKRHVKSEFRCGDCEQFLCSSCRTTHDSLNPCKDHTVVDVEDFVATVGDDKFVQTELTRHQNHLDYLQTLISDIKNSSEAANKSIDEQVDEICSHVKKLGEEIKEENEKLRRKEEEKMRKLVEKSETLVEDLKSKKASIKQKGGKAEVKIMKMHIPYVNYPLFEKGEIEETQLSEQLGKLEMKGPTFTTSFNFDDEDLQSGELLEGDEYNIGGLSWYVGVKKERVFVEDTLGIYLYLTPSVKSCDVEYSLKLINHKDIRESVEEHKDRNTFTSDGWYRGWLFIDWNRFSNKQNGFLTEDNKFTVQVTVKVLKIER